MPSDPKNDTGSQSEALPTRRTGCAPRRTIPSAATITPVGATDRALPKSPAYGSSTMALPPDRELSCNDCHALHWQDDAVLTPSLSLD